MLVTPPMKLLMLRKSMLKYSPLSKYLSFLFSPSYLVIDLNIRLADNAYFLLAYDSRMKFDLDFYYSYEF